MPCQLNQSALPYCGLPSVFTINCEKFKPEHIVPLVFIDDNSKSINESKKRKSS